MCRENAETESARTPYIYPAQYNISNNNNNKTYPGYLKRECEEYKKFANLNILGNLLDMWQSNQLKSQESYNVTQRWTLSHVRLTTHTTVISLCRPTRTSTTGHNNGRLRGIKTAVTLTTNFVIKFNVAYNQCYFFLKKICSGTHSDPKFGQRVLGVTCIDDRGQCCRTSFRLASFLKTTYETAFRRVPSQNPAYNWILMFIILMIYIHISHLMMAGCCWNM
jgi:hypothetical protein